MATDFKKLLDDKMKKAAQATSEAASPADNKPDKAITAPKQAVTAPEEAKASHEPPPVVSRAPEANAEPKKKKTTTSDKNNTNRVTVNLFDVDRRALAVIKEHLDNAGHDFTSRSDSIKIALRYAAKAKKEDLAKLLVEVKAEDRRFRES